MLRLHLITIFAFMALLARSQDEENLSKLEALSGMKSEQESPSGFFSFSAETDIDAGAKGKFCLRLSGQASGLQEENFLAFGAMPGRRFALSEFVMFEVEGGPGFLLVQRKELGDVASESDHISGQPELAFALHTFSRVAYKEMLYGEGYLVNAFYDDRSAQHIKAEIGFSKKHWNPFFSYDTLYRLAVGSRYEIRRDVFQLKPGLGLSWSGEDLGSVFSVSCAF